MENTPSDDDAHFSPLAYHKHASVGSWPGSPPHPAYIYKVGVYEIECQKTDFLRPFAHFTGNVESERLLEMSNDNLAPLIQGADSVCYLKMAIQLHEWANAPDFGLNGLRYGPLDPSCPEVDETGDYGRHLAASLLKTRDINVSWDIFDEIPTKSLEPFLPFYTFPWINSPEIWPSHVAQLLVHLYHMPIREGFKSNDLNQIRHL